MSTDPGTYVISTDFVRPLLDGQGLRMFGSSSGYVGIKPADAAGSTDFTLPAADGSNGQAMVTNGSGVLSFADVGVTDHGALSGLSDDDHLQYFRQAGRFGGQLMYGGIAPSNNLFVQSTSNATKGYVLLENFAEFRTTDVRFRGSTSGYVGLKPPAVGDNTIYRLPTSDGTSGQVMRTDGAGNLSFVTPSAGVTDHGALTGLSNDDHSQYALLAGRSGGQTLYGGTAAADDIVIVSTTNATKGNIVLNDTTMLVVDKAANQLRTSTTPSGDTGIVNRSYMRANNLTIGTAKTASFTAEVGTLHPVTLTSLTSDPVVTFPLTPNTGEKFGFFVNAAHSSGGTSTNFADRPYFCVEPTTGTNINGSSYTRVAGEGGGKYSLWLAGEMLIFQYTGSTWLLIEDGRIPHVCVAKRTSAQSIAHATLVNIQYDSEDVDNAALHSTSSNTDRIYAKRSGNYLASAASKWSVNSTSYRRIAIQINNATDIAIDRRNAVNESEASISTFRNMSATDYVVCGYFHAVGSAINTGAVTNILRIAEHL